MLKNTCYTIIINIKKGRRLQKKDELMKEVYIDIMEKRRSLNITSTETGGTEYIKFHAVRCIYKYAENNKSIKIT